jgi:hypothetical protein
MSDLLSSLKAQIERVSGILTEAYARSDENAGMIFFRNPSFFLQAVNFRGNLLIFLLIRIIGRDTINLVILSVFLGKRHVFFIDAHNEQVDRLLVR